MIALLCVLTFALQLVNEPLDTILGRVTHFELQYAFIPALVSEEPWRWITAPFLHIAPWHLLNNVGFVLILGSWLEEDIGSVRVAVLFTAGALAGEAYYLTAGQEFDVVLGASGGLMAIAGAAVVTERRAVFAAQRQRLAGLTIVLTVGLSIVAPALGALGAHVVGAVCGVVLGFVFPPPLRARARHARDMEKAATDWEEARATVKVAASGNAVLVLQPTRARTVAVGATVALVIVTGISIGLQSVFISDDTSATVALIAAVWTIGTGFLLWMRVSVTQVRIDLNGLTGRYWKTSVPWSEVEALYPGHIFSGLVATGAVGFIRRDGKRFGVPTAGHRVRPLALHIETIRQAANRT